MKKKIGSAVLVSVGLLGMSVAQASLMSVGTGLVYDNVANVTWSSDANLLGTMEAANPNLISQIITAVPTVHDTPNFFDTPANSGNYNLTSSDFFGAGYADWFGQMAFMGYLNGLNGGAGYLGHNGWMLPTTYDQTCRGYNCTNSMLGELFYTGLGGTAGQSITTSHNANFNLFTNVQNDWYWSGTGYTSGLSLAWGFGTVNGNQNVGRKYYSNYSWAALSGNFAAVQTPGAAVPEPADLALFGVGLLGLMAGRRRG